MLFSYLRVKVPAGAQSLWEDVLDEEYNLSFMTALVKVKAIYPAKAADVSRTTVIVIGFDQQIDPDVKFRPLR